MALEPGTRLSHYEVVSSLGAGGMGEVYRARDTKLGREVAIKLLLEEVAADPDRLSRFKREARVLASISHTNIAGIYQIECIDDLHFLAMELVAGEDLARLLERGPLPETDAIAIALQIAEGLEAAHERGIVHRDLKPANIMVDSETHGVKLLDFGLAKPVPVSSGADSGLSHSPTLTAQMTGAGVLLGTAAYMSPEQARGKTVDKRADVWAFGCILFEMLTGQRPFKGEGVTEILASILRDEPNLENLPTSVPISARRVIAQCLQKDPRRRLRDIGDARNELEESWGTSEPADRGRRPAMAPWVLVGLLAALCVVLFVAPIRTGRQSPPPLRRFAIDLPWHSVPNWSDFVATLSPTGGHLAYNGRVNNRVDAYVRSLDSLEARAVAPSREASWYAFSPDGDWLAVLNGDELSKVPLRGGQAIRLPGFERATVRDASDQNERISFRGLQGAFGLSWGPAGDLLVGTSDGLYRVPTAGGALEPVTRADEAAGDLGHGYPRHLPGGSRALLSILQPGQPPQVAVADLADGSLKRLGITGSEAAYAASGHLVVRQGSVIVAAPFDLGGLRLSGDPARVLEGVEMGPSIAEDGTMLYVPSRGDASARLAWVDRAGRRSLIDDERRNYSHLDLKDDGKTAFLNVGLDVYSMDLERGTRQLLASGALFPIFGPDDSQLTMYRNGLGIFRQASDGNDGEEVLIPAQAFRRIALREEAMAPSSPDAALEEAAAAKVGSGASALRGTLVPTSWNPRTGDLAFFDDASDIWVMSASGDLRPFLQTEANERTGRFSPDGRWLAYVSDETGEYQVYATEYPGPGRKIPVSIDGGLSPIWSADGKELLFRNGGKLMSVAISRQPELNLASPIELFEGPYTLDLMGHQRWDAAPDGEHFLMVESSEDFRIVIVQNFFEELERLVPTD